MKPLILILLSAVVIGCGKPSTSAPPVSRSAPEAIERDMPAPQYQKRRFFCSPRPADMIPWPTPSVCEV